MGDTLTTDSVEFSWFPSGDNFGISMYKLDYWGPQSGSLETPDTSVVLELGRGTFYFTITAFDSAGNSSVSDTGRFVIEHITLPTLVPISPADTIIKRVAWVPFVWSPGSKEILENSRIQKLQDYKTKTTRTFIIQISTWDSTFSNPNVIDTVSDTTIYENFSERQVYWRVREIDSNGNLSYWSQIAHFLADTTRPSTPYQIIPEDSAEFDTNVVTFMWHSSYDALSGLSHYQLEYHRLYGDTSEFYYINLTDTVVSVEIPRICGVSLYLTQQEIQNSQAGVISR